MNKKFFTFLYLLLIASRLVAQVDIKKHIDSINHLPYNQRILTNKVNEHNYIHILKQAAQIKYDKGVAEAHANLALIYFYQGDKIDSSISHLLKANAIYDALKMEEASANLTAMYGYILRKKDIKKAEKFMSTAIQKAEQIQADFSLLGMYDNYGVIKQDLGQLDSAKYFYNKALTNKRIANDSIGLPYSYNKLGMLYLALGKFDVSKLFLDSAYVDRIRLNDSIGIAENYSFYGQFYQKTGNAQNAVYYFEQALSLSKKLGYKNLIKQNYQSIAEVLETTQDYKNALYYYKQFTMLNDSLNDETIQINRDQLEVAYETAEKEKQLLIQRADLAESHLSIEKKQQQLIIIIGLLAISILLGYLFYFKQKQKANRLIEENKLKEALLEIKTQEQLQQQRLKISRDLHDNIGAQLTFIISSIDNLRYVVNKDNDITDQKLKHISEFTQQTITELRDTIWAMNQDGITFETLKLRIHNFISNASNLIANIDFSFQIDDAMLHIELNSLEGMNVYRTIQEAINNAIKHAHATTINISIAIANKDGYNYLVAVSDNGIGFDTTTINFGNGLYNMKKRIEAINGIVTIEANQPSGTCINIYI